MSKRKSKSKQIKKSSQTKKDESKIEIKGNHELEKFLDNCIRERRIIENFGRNSVKKISNVNLEKVDFKNLTLKNCKFVDSKIKFSHISENSYLRKSKFTNVDFTGTVFENVNLEKAEFKDCKLYYVRFEDCIVDYKNILENKPDEPNLAMNLIKSLYKNELQQGNTKEADELFLLYKKEERRFFYYLIGWEKLISWKKAEKNSDEMYQNKKYYDEYRKDKKLNRFSVFLKLISSWTNNIIWGYGIKIHRIVTSMILGILIFSFIYFSITDINYLDSIFLSFKTWMLNNEYESNNKVVSAFMILENLLGLVSLALFTSAFYRKVEK